MKSRPVSVNVTANGLAANQAQQTANQAQASAIKYKTAWEEANAENLAALSTAQSEFKSNLAWVKSQIHEGKHQNDSAVASLQSDMESSWGSMSTVEQSLYNSASTATSEVDSHLESLRAQNSQSLADLHNTANSLHAAATSLHADANAMRSSLTAATSELGKDITTTRSSLDGVRNSLRTASSELGDNLAGARNSLAAVDSSLRTATSEVGNNLNSVKNSLAAVDADLRNGIKQANNDLSAAKTSLTATGNSLANRAGSLATATSELQRQTGQLSGSLSTADSMIMFNSNAIAEVKRTAGEISTTVSNIRVGGRNLLRNSAKLPYFGNFNDNSWPTGQWRIAGCTNDTDDMKRTSKEITDPPQGNKATALSYTGVLRSSVNDISLVAINSVPISGNVTVSFWARQTSGVDKAFVSAGWGGRGMLNTNASTEKWGTTQYRKLFLPKDGSWTRFWATFNVNSKENVYIGAGNTGTSAEVQICLVKIETGTMVTDWTPAPEDTDQAISKVSQTADAIKADLANTKGDVASVKATASSLQTQITNNKNNISTVKQTADSLTSTVGQMPAKWQQAINDKASAQVLTSGVDMNNLTTAGTYLVTDFSAKNTPIGAYFMAVVESTADKSRILQRVKKDDSSVAYERSNYNRGWTAWERTATGTDITQVKQTIDGITTRVSNTEGNVSGLQQTAKSIQTSVSDNAKNISNVQQTATALQSDLSNAKGDISSLQQTASGLQSTVQSQSGKISQLQQDADGLKLTATGGGNLLNSTSDTLQKFSGKSWSYYPSSSDEPVAKHQVDGKTVTLSAWIENPSKEAWVQMYTDKGKFQGNRIPAGGKGWSQVTYTMPSGFSGWNIVVGCGDGSGEITLSYSSLQLELGPNRTAWSQSTADIAQLKVTAGKIQTQVNDNKGNISSLQQTATALQSSLSNAQGEISNVKQTASKLQSDLSNAKGDISTLKQTASGLTSRVGNAEGSISQLQQTANGLTSTVSAATHNNDSLVKTTTFMNGLGEWSGYNAQDTIYVIDVKDVPNNLYTKALHSSARDTLATKQFIPVTPGDKYNVEIYFNSHGFSCGFGVHTTTNSYSWARLVSIASTETGWVRKKATWTVPNDVSQAMAWVQLDYDSSNTLPANRPNVWIAYASFTKIDSVLDASISQIQQTADRIQSQVNDNKGNISSVAQTANAVKTDLANTKGDVSSLRQTAKQLTSDMADAKGNISRLQQTATGLQSTVQSQSGKISQLQQDTKGLTATVADGGQNLILNSGNPSTLDHWRWKGEVTLQKHPFWKNGTENLFVLWNTSSTDEKFFSNERFAIEPNQDYTLSFYAFNNSALKNADVWYLPRKSSSSNDYDTAINLASVVKFSTDNAQYIRLTFNSGDYDEGYIRFDNNSSTTEGTWAGLYLADIQLEKGKIATAWSNSPGDIAQLKLTADGLTSTVADAQGNISKLQQTATGLQTQITNNKNDVASVKVTADSVKTDLTNAKGDISSLKSKADSLTSSMTNANGQISTLQQRADSLTSTLSNGGVNLLNGTSDTEITNTYPTSGFTDKVYYAMSVPANRTDYVLSFDAKATVAGDKINCYMYSSNQVTKAVSSQNVTSTNADGNMSFTLATNWVRYWVHYTITPTDQKPTIIVGRTVHGSGSGTVSFKCAQLEYGDIATPWQPSNGDISSLQQTAQGLTADMRDAKGNISSLQVTAGGLTSDVRDAKGNISSLQQKATELDAQIKAVDGRATTIKATADGISARVSKIEGNQTVGSLLKLTGNEAGLGSYVNGKLIAGINTNTNGNVTIDGKQIHLTHYTQIDDGCINASKITVHNSVGNDNGEAKDQYLAAAWGQLNSTIGKTTDNGKTSLWGSINQTAEKFSSYYTRADVDNKLSQQSSLISQTANNITALVNDAKNFTTFTVSSTNKWDFNNTKSAYGNWFLNGDTSSNYVYNGPSYTWGQKLAPCMYVTSRGPKDGSRFVVTVWKDNDPTQYQRVWNGSWSDWVMLPNSQNLISAINLSPDSVKISGKNIELNGNTKVTGRLDLMQDSARSVSQSTNYHNNWVWNNAHIYFDNYLQLLGENCNVHYTNTNTTLNGGKTFYSITTLTPGYLKFTTYNHKVNDTDENFDGQITRSYLDSGRLETPEVYTDKFVITGHHIRVRDNQFLMLTNKKGTNFDNNGSVGFQVWGGIVLGQNTIGAPSNELYFQRGNIDAILGQSYSDAPKLTLHAQKVVSQEANSVSSRLSVKTSITKVTYDRALMAVQNTDMYDYRYIADNAGQHYVSGIIDDVHDKPEYNMDPMLINQERTARIDANLLGYHHVVLQEILKRLDKLEAK